MLMMNTYCVSSNMMTALNSFHLMLMTAHKLGNIVTSFYRGGNQSFKRFGYLAKITQQVSGASIKSRHFECHTSSPLSSTGKLQGSNRCQTASSMCSRAPNTVLYTVCIYYVLGWPKSSFGFFCKILWKIPFFFFLKNLIKLFGQPSNLLIL